MISVYPPKDSDWVSLGTSSFSCLKYWVSFSQFLFSPLKPFQKEALVFPYISPSLFSLLLKSSFPSNLDTYFFPHGWKRHVSLCLCQQKVVGEKKIPCRAHFTRGRSQTYFPCGTWSLVNIPTEKAVRMKSEANSFLTDILSAFHSFFEFLCLLVLASWQFHMELSNIATSTHDLF